MYDYITFPICTIDDPDHDERGQYWVVNLCVDGNAEEHEFPDRNSALRFVESKGVDLQLEPIVDQLNGIFAVPLPTTRNRRMVKPEPNA